MSLDRDESNRPEHEPGESSAGIRDKQQEYNRRYYLVYRRKWKQYAKTRRKRIAEQVRKEHGGMQL